MPARMPPRKPPQRAKKKPTVAGAAGKTTDGDAAVRQYYAELPPPQRDLGVRGDALIAREVPGVRRAMKWSMPFYGVEGRGWFCAFGAYKQHCAVRFLRGTELVPPPPDGTSALMRGVSIRDVSELDEAQMASWVRQAAALPGWGSGGK